MKKLLPMKHQDVNYIYGPSPFNEVRECTILSEVEDLSLPASRISKLHYVDFKRAIKKLNLKECPRSQIFRIKYEKSNRC